MKVLLLAGGDSSERAVSLTSGKAVYEALVRQKHVVFAIDPATGKSVLTSDGRFPELRDSDKGLGGPAIKNSNWSLANSLGSPGFRDIDVVFIALHGGNGENGVIQCLLELAGRPFTGSSQTASAIAMDKAITKRLAGGAGVTTPDWSLYHVEHSKIDNDLLESIGRRFAPPFIVKPNNGGSTIGLSIVRDEDELAAALERAAAETPRVLIEHYIKGREITAAVLDGEPLPLVEIVPKKGLYDYEAKYTKGMSEYIVPALLDKDLAIKIQEAAVTVFGVIGAAGLARVDFIVDESGVPYFLEINTLPGMTALSLAPMAAGAAGISFDDLVERLIETAVRHHK